MDPTCWKMNQVKFNFFFLSAVTLLVCRYLWIYTSFQSKVVSLNIIGTVKIHCIQKHYYSNNRLAKLFLKTDVYKVRAVLKRVYNIL